MADRLDGDDATGAAGVDRRIHPRLSALTVLVRRAGDSGLACGNPHRDNTNLGAVSISAASGYGRGVLSAAAAGDDGIDRRAEENSGAARLQHRGRQGGPKALDPLWLGARTGTASRARRTVAVGLFALLDPIRRRAVARLRDAVGRWRARPGKWFCRLF